VSGPEILDAALRAFARYGYDGTSVRTLTRELGLTHNALPQRFGSKEQLWYACVDHGFGGLIDALAGDGSIETDPFDQLRGAIRRFLLHSAEHPELHRIMAAEGSQDTPRLRYLYDTYVGPATAPMTALLEWLATKGRVRPASTRTLHFLITSGGASPYSMVALARLLGPDDPLEPAAVEAHADLVADLIVTGLRH
jgi:AcrR family transcriptional regulator